MMRLEEWIRFDVMICRADLTRRQDAFVLHGAYTVSIKTSCDNCLDPVVVNLDREFDLILVGAENHEEQGGDYEISLRSEDVDYFSGDEIPLSDYFEEQLLLDLPFSIKCSDNCRGICPECGVNLNHEACMCSKRAGNKPFSVLDEFTN